MKSNVLRPGVPGDFFCIEQDPGLVLMCTIIVQFSDAVTSVSEYCFVILDSGANMVSVNMSLIHSIGCQDFATCQICYSKTLSWLTLILVTEL